MTTTSTRETHVSADPDVPLFRITREFDAPRARVFRAYADPQLVVQWLGPRDTAMTVDHYDCRTGGSYRYVHTPSGRPGAGADHWFHGSFHEVRPAELIVQTFTFEGFPDAVSLERLVLEDLPGGRTRLVVTSLYESFAARDAVLVSGMEGGVRQSYERLDELLGA